MLVSASILAHALVARLLAFQPVQQLTQRHLRLAAQDEVQRRKGTHRLQRHGRDMGAKGHRRGAERLGQEDAVHVVAQRRRRHLGQVVLGALLLQQLRRTPPSSCAWHWRPPSRPCTRARGWPPSAPGSTCGQIMFSRLRRPTRCWLRIQIAPSAVGGFTSMTSTAPSGRSAWGDVPTLAPASGKFDGRNGGILRVPRLLRISGDNSIFGLLKSHSPSHRPIQHQRTWVIATCSHSL